MTPEQLHDSLISRCANGRSAWRSHDRKNCSLCCAADLIESQAQRIRELEGDLNRYEAAMAQVDKEGAAITDAAKEKAWREYADSIECDYTAPTVRDDFNAGWNAARELEGAVITDAADWLAGLEIGENQEDDPDGPFTPSECAPGRSLFEYAMRDRAAVTSSKIGTWNPDRDSVRCAMQFGWYTAARELLRSAQTTLRSESHQASEGEGKDG